MDLEQWLPLAFFVVTAAFAFSNLYVVVYLRRSGEFTLDLLGFLSLTLGDVKNYKKLNGMFSAACREHGHSPAARKFVAFLHLWSPIVFGVLFLASVGLAFLQPL